MIDFFVILTLYKAADLELIFLISLSDVSPVDRLSVELK